ncbi:diacylglycerol kinase 1 isoform X3 [Drosophila persimilis]|uniref:diacylglycerol kinase 1 isoform X3 n=1 Tax=Drosophila persimilis TaxID=7234 RepID=UPI000F0889D2|nr:diacylglycerol kinase 1 isoform X3 [Drosophila persimilis]
MSWQLRYGWQIVTSRANCSAASAACHTLATRSMGAVYYQQCSVSLTCTAEKMQNLLVPQRRKQEQDRQEQQEQQEKQPKRMPGNFLLRCCCICKFFLHNRCASSVKKECTLGENAELVVPPTAICPAVLDRQRSVNQAHKKSQMHHHQATHFQITPPDELSCPLLVFVNPKSGGRQGDRILRKFQYMLNPRQVYDLSKGGPKEGLTLFKDLPNFKVICCGGDGTVGWVLEAMDSIELATQPAIGVIPLGTGNDLARCLRWGGGYEGENIPKLMDKIKRATTVMLDRWSIEVTNTPATDELRPKVTLHSNMQKVIELSQSVVVDKSLIERFEEIQEIERQSSSSSTGNIVGKQPTASTSATSIMMATATEFRLEEEEQKYHQQQRQQDGGGDSTTTTMRTTTTKSISMSTFESKSMRTTLRGTLSSRSSSSNTSSGGNVQPQPSMEGEPDAEGDADGAVVPGAGDAAGDEAETLQIPARRTDETEKQSLETLLLQHKQQQQKQQQQLQQELASDAGEEVATAATSFGNNQSDNNSQRNKQNNILKQQITLSLDLSDHDDDNEEEEDGNCNSNSNSNSNGNGRVAQNPSTPQTPITPITPTTPNAPCSMPQKPIKVQSDKDCTVPYNIINNYFSVGVDAAICVKFHLEREKNPHKFNSRMKNKLWYFEYATSETFAASCKNLHESIEIVCDGVALDLANGPHLQGVALLNIPYTHGGSNLWGEHLSQKRMRKSAGPFGKSKKLKSSDKEFSATSFNSVDLSVAIQDIGDRLIEVIGLENCLHMGQVRTGLRASGRRLAQCSEVIIKTKKTFPMQIDGEPWMQMPCTIKVTHKNQVPMLMAARSEKGRGFFNMLCS